MQGGYKKNHYFRPIYRFISQMLQDRAVVTMEGEEETAPKLSNGTGLNDLVTCNPDFKVMLSFNVQ